MPDSMADMYSGASLTELERAIMALETQLSFLKEQRNRIVVPLYRIPEEVVVKILRHTQVARLEEIEDMPVHNAIAWWARELMFCRRIWTIAQRTPELWSYIPVGYGDPVYSLRLVDVCVQRSASHPITLYVSLSPIEAISELLKPLIPHTIELHLRIPDYMIHVFSPSQKAILSALFAVRWPRLERVSVYNWYYNEEGVIDFHFLSGLGESLIALNMEPSILSWMFKDKQGSSLQNLRSLQIGSLVMDDQNRLRAWVESMPRLVSLDLSFAYDSPEESEEIMHAYTDQYPVHLPNLRFVDLRGTSNQLLMVLAIFPESYKELRLHCNRSSVELSDKYNELINYALVLLDHDHEADKIQYMSTLKLHEDTNRDTDRKNRGLFYSVELEIFSTRSMPRRRFHLQGERGRLYELRALAQVVHKIEFASKALYDAVDALVPVLRPDVLSVAFANWEWYRERTYSLQGLAQSLRNRQRDYRPLTALVVDTPSSTEMDTLESEWMSEGLVGEVFRRRRVKFDVSCFYDD